MKEVGSIRRSQIVTTFGPGSIVDFRLPSGALLSGVMQGLEAWDAYALKNKGLNDPQIIHEPRLENRLGVKGFRPPPIGHDKIQGEKRDRVLPIRRFPEWQSCPECHVIQPAGQWAPTRSGDSLQCSSCSGKPSVLPVRFVTICENGHLNDFPWASWIPHSAKCSKHLLRLVTVGAGISGLRVECVNCKVSRSMGEAFSPNGIPGHFCQGGRPWLLDYQMGCKAPPRITQRGASNVHFSVEESAISLPDWRSHFSDRLGTHKSTLDAISDPDTLLAVVHAAVMPHWDGEESAVDIVRSILEMRAMAEEDKDADLRVPEFNMLCTDTSDLGSATSELLNKKQEIPHQLASKLEWVSSVERLREVRALTGFTRLKAQVGGKPETVPLSRFPKDWLPGVQVHGEGIFLALNNAEVAKWEATSAVRSHMETMLATYISARLAEGDTPDGAPPELTARYILVHTLAHAMIATLSLESGYSSSALRERLYVGANMAGLLIYTSTPDADGTMGGLSRQARKGRLEGLILQALADQELCSADPLCGEGLATRGANGNHAACHSCAFLPETSCEMFNSFLDRSLLSASDLGFFANLMITT
jgi:hypothetical protein